MTLLRCPVCKTDLCRRDKQYVCTAGHSFDIARQGYVNLLLSSQMPSKAPGDSAEMIADRRAFLDAGHYQPLRDAVIAQLDRLQTATDQCRKYPQRILDLGCGEGYYTAAFTANHRDVIALDIAKPALAIAAKRNSAITWCVGTSRALPLHDASVDVVLNIFCRPHITETQRVLRADGVLLHVGPGPRHLEALRHVLYENVVIEDSHSLGDLLQHGFTLHHIETLRYTFTLQQPAIVQLARMTPHYWRAPQAGRTRLEQMDSLTLDAEFVLQELRIDRP
jgi:23S rRNA (guanine745-N1)-methyltransferase